MECGYKVKINNKVVKDGSNKELFFDSDQQLDQWVEENFFLNPKNLERLRKYTKGKAILFDSAEEADAQSRAVKVIDEIKTKLENRTDKVQRVSGSKLAYTYDEETDDFVLDSESSTSYARLVSVTNYINITGNRKDVGKAAVTASDERDYIEWLKKDIETKMRLTERDAWVKQYGTSNDANAQWEAKIVQRQKEIVEKYKKKRKYAQLIGEDIHHMMEIHALERMGQTGHLAPGYVLTKADQEAAMPVTKEIFNEICKDYNFSENAIFLPEFNIFGDHIDNATKRVLQEKLDKEQIDGVFGRVDLLVIDKGKAYIFDFKTTAEKEVYDWQVQNGPSNEESRKNGYWTSTKKLEAMEQIAMYLAILKQQGIPAGGGKVIPITVNYQNDSDGYPENVETENVKVDGKEIMRATQNPEHHNIKGLYLDRSTERWDASTMAMKRSSEPLIMKQYLPWARTQVSPIKPLDVREMNDVTEDMEMMFPSRAGRSHKEFEVTVNYYLGRDEDGKQIGESRIIELSSDSIMRIKYGYSYMMYTSPKVNLGEGAGKPIYFKTKDDSEVIPKIEKYCKALNEVLHQEFNSFANGLQNIMQIEGRDYSEIDEVLTSFVGNDPRRKEYVRTMFKKYMTGDWNLYGANDPENKLVQNGVFIFYKNDIVEIVMLSHDPLHYEVNFGTKRRPLKSILNGLDPQPIDGWNSLSSSRGNMLLVKALDIISKDSNIYRNGQAKIRSITAINPWHMQSSFADNDVLWDVWTAMCARSHGKLNPLPKSAFMPSVQACLDEAKEILFGTSLWSYMNGIFENQLKSEEDIIKLIKLIRSKDSNSFNEDGTPKIDTEVGYSVWCLLNALTINRKLRVPIEHDKGKILEAGIIPTGTEVQSPGNSNSVTMRTLDALTGSFRTVYSRINNERIDLMQKHVKTIYDKCRYNPNVMSRKEFWAQFFEREEGSKRVGKQMRIINFSSDFWNKYDPEVKVAFKYILDTLAGYKGLRISSTNTTLESVDPEKYYEIPLSKGSFIDSIKANASDNGIKGVFDVAKDRIKKIKYKAESLYFGDEDIYVKEGMNSEDLLKGLTNAYCVYDASQRAEWCKNDTMAYSTDIEAILGVTTAAQAISEASQTYCYLYAALKTALAVNEKFGGEKVPELKDTVNDYITRIYKGENIMNASNRALAGVIGTIKGITSKMALGFNTRAFSREMLVSLYTGIMRTANYQVEGVSAEDFAFGMGYVLRHAPANINKYEFVGQLNRLFQMAGQSREEIGSANFISDFGLRTVDMENLAYMGTTIPDNYYRLAILIARMHADGCFDAYSLDEDNKLKYDAKKDKRFAKYLTDSEVPTFKEYDPSMGPKSAYLSAKSLWNSFLDEWKLVFPNSNYETLPEAYPPSYIRSMQQAAGKLYGYFDSDQKSLMCYQFIGSALMQYKTWLSAKIDQWIKKPGFTNVWQQVHKRDENGNPLYIVSHTAEEIAEGMPALEFVTENEITDEMMASGNVVPYIVLEGTFAEGMIQSTFAFADTLIHMGPAEFLKMWKDDPIARGNFICGFMDMWGMMLFAGLINLLFGEEMQTNKSAQPWLSQWTYGVLMGFAEDGPVHQVLGSMVGDWNPPSLMTIKKTAQITQSVLAGTKTIPQGFLESFGATREFSGYFRE